MTIRTRMSRRCALLYGLAVSAAALLLLQAISGLVLWLAIPRGQGGGGGLGRGAGGLGGVVERTFAGLGRSSWVTLHDWAAIAFVAVVVFHVILHWRWLVRQTRTAFVRTGTPIQSEANCSD